MEHISRLLPGSIRRSGIEGEIRAARAIFAARSFLHERLPHVQTDVDVRSYRDGILVIACRSSVAAQECALSIPDLRAHLARMLPDLRLKDVRFVR